MIEGTKILFTPEGGGPEVPGDIIRVYGHSWAYISVTNGKKGNGKTDFTNTDTHGSTVMRPMSDVREEN